MHSADHPPLSSPQPASAPKRALPLPLHVGMGVLLCAAAITGRPALAATGPEEGELTTILALLVVMGLAYLAAHFAVDAIQRRLLIVSGLEYVFLGMLLGPVVFPEMHIFQDFAALAPVVAFASGWVGLLYGMELDLRTLLSIPDRSIRLAFAETTVSITAVAAIAAWFLQSGLLGLPPVSASEAWMSAGVLGTAAAASSSSAVDLLAARYPKLESRLLVLLRRTTRLEDMFAIVAYGILFCVFHNGVTLTPEPPAFSDWILLTAGLGVALGFLFTIFLGEDRSENSRFLALVGIIIFASGAAFFLNLSALLVNLLLGVVIVNTRHGAGVFQTLVRTQRPVRLILLVFAGALWVPVPWLPALVLTVGFIVLRLVCKAVGGLLAGIGTALRNDLFRGLLAQGEVTVAMAIAFQLVYDGPTVDLVYTAILASVVFYEAVAPRMLKGLLVDAGELRQEMETHRPSEAAHPAEGPLPQGN